jgi:hypothetical protein
VAVKSHWHAAGRTRLFTDADPVLVNSFGVRGIRSLRRLSCTRCRSDYARHREGPETGSEVIRGLCRRLRPEQYLAIAPGGHSPAPRVKAIVVTGYRRRWHACSSLDLAEREIPLTRGLIGPLCERSGRYGTTAEGAPDRVGVRSGAGRCWQSTTAINRCLHRSRCCRWCPSHSGAGSSFRHCRTGFRQLCCH